MSSRKETGRKFGVESGGARAAQSRFSRLRPVRPEGGRFGETSESDTNFSQYNGEKNQPLSPELPKVTKPESKNVPAKGTGWKGQHRSIYGDDKK